MTSIYAIPISRRNYSIVDNNNFEIGKLVYNSYFSQNASIQTLENLPELCIYKKSFLGKTFHVDDEKGCPMFEISTTTLKRINIADNQADNNYVFKQKSFFSRQYILLNDQNETICQIEKDINLKNLRTKYLISYDELKTEQNVVFLVLFLKKIIEVQDHI